MTRNQSLLEIYKIAVEMADRLSARRGLANTFFITLESAFISSISFWLAKSHELPFSTSMALIAISFVLAVLWWFQIASYRNLSAAKFKVIHELEREFSKAPFTREWKLVQSTKRRHIDLSQIERIVPLVVFVIEITLIISAIK